MASFSNMEYLYNNLTTGRNKYIRPQNDYIEATNITISFHLINLQEINAVDGTVSITGYFTVSWNDSNLVWTPTDYDNAELIAIPQDHVWKPSLINSNTAKEFKLFGVNGLYVQINYTGNVTWLPGQNLVFTCSIDTTYFPFDVQECECKIINWGYGEGDIFFTSLLSTVDTESYSLNSEWDLTKTSATADNTGTPTVKYKFYFKRRPLFLLINLIFPAMFLAILNICVFLLPQDSGERIGFSITLLLAVVVFLTIAQGILPATAEPRLSAICVILLVDMVMSGMIVASVIVSSWFYYQADDEKVPDWIKKVVRFKLHWCRNKRANKVFDNMRGKEKLPDGEVMSQDENNGKSEEKITWQNVAKFWDRMSLVFYILSFICGNLFFIIDVSKGN